MVSISRQTARRLCEIVREANISDEEKKDILDELIDAIRMSLEITDQDVRISIHEAKALVHDYTSMLFDELRSRTPDDLSYRTLRTIEDIANSIEDELVTTLDGYVEAEKDIEEEEERWE